MWNHSSKSNSKVLTERIDSVDSKDQGCDLEKVEKYLDLTNYLNFLQNLFNRSTSDSESSDVELESTSTATLGVNISDMLSLESPSPSNIKIPSKKSAWSKPQSPFLSSAPKSMIITSHETSSESSSTNSSPFAHDDGSSVVSSFLPTDLTPMTDLELNNLLKRTNYLGSDDVEIDAMNFDLDDQDTAIPTIISALDNDDSTNNKKQNKKKKRKSKNNSDLHELPRQNRPNSGGKGNGHGPSHTGGEGGGGEGNCGGGGAGGSSSSGFNGSVSDSRAEQPASTIHVPTFPQPNSNSEDESDDSPPSSVESKSETGDESSRSMGSKERGTKRKGSPEKEGVKNKRILLQKQAKYIELMNLKRKKIYLNISKKEVPKAQRTIFSTHKDELAIRRKLAHACSKVVRQKAIQSQKTAKESVWRAKRLTREMQAFWKQADRVEKENKKRKDKEDEEQRKQDVEVLEAKRLQQNLNFLITETELYAHLTTRKLHEGLLVADNVTNSSILDRLKVDGSTVANHEVDSMKIKAKINVHEAFEAQKIHTKLFNIDFMPKSEPTDDSASLFSGKLKNYQILGVNWLSKLFDHGVNGVLADEIGLGKTVQSIAFLAYLAEMCGIWGPFLVIAPSSSLHHWQQEIKRFIGEFKIVPYWGNPQERKILRQYWQQTNLHTREASFHVVITSYNVVVQDLKYFNKVKWQYLILDEAQAIKTAVSSRWKALIGFNCRNRLLLTGLPIQDSINELLSLLHFIMPSLFISQEDFVDWFSKEQEMQPDNNGVLEKKNRTRLYSVLEQFMLRRTKKDVENELCDKVEILLPCPLTTRQRFFHAALVRKIVTEDLLKASTTCNDPISSPAHDTRNLMSLVMQFRKVCNHPDLFERRDMKSPLFLDTICYPLPKLLFQDYVAPDSTLYARNHLFKERFNIFKPYNIHYSLFREGFNRRRDQSKHKNNIQDVHIANVGEKTVGGWSFLRFSGLGSGDIYKFICDGTTIQRMNDLVNFKREMCIIRKRLNSIGSLHFKPTEFLIYTSCEEKISETLQNLVFTSNTKSFYKWNSVSRMSTTNELLTDDDKVEYEYVIPNGSCCRVADDETSWDLEALCVPKFLLNLCPKVRCCGIQSYISDGPTTKWIKTAVGQCLSHRDRNIIMYGNPEGLEVRSFFEPPVVGGLLGLGNVHGWSDILMPDKERLVTDSGKLMILDGLLKNLKKVNGRRVVIYSLLPKMMDLLEEYFRYRQWTYIRVDGQKNQSEILSKSDTFAILLTTMTANSGLIGQNLSEMDTIIFYDNDWNSTIDQHSIDLADRLGQTGHAKQVTVYKLFSKGTIEERILRKIKQRSDTKVVETPDNQPETLTPKEILSLLIDEDDVDRKCRQRQVDRKAGELKSSDKKPIVKQNGISSASDQSDQPAVNLTNGDTDSLKAPAGSSGGSFQSQQSSPSSQEESDDMDSDLKDLEFDVTVYGEDLSELNPSNSDDYFDNYSRAIEWNNGSTSDYEEDLPFIPKKPKLGRGSGKRRGRPPSRVRVQMRDISLGGDMSMRRGPGRPRLKPIGPLNQGIRGRRPGRPPLSKKAETISANLSPLASTPRVFGIYNSQDLNMSSS
ncbi:chromatin-remodeling ATPase INO80 isoform X2 [Folsomia candida]|uniref:chromatin-remodeling ATPase INO80 isoform X2 n=1 Tax=Folsomia candida TaxID=158441 RepID=UPI000B8FF618|nr:chromatin-remodeling ATPase INO80 isoform X2 [Folsomia candida]